MKRLLHTANLMMFALLIILTFSVWAYAAEEETSVDTGAVPAYDLNITDTPYGANGDDDEDDTQAIQAALKEAGNTGEIKTVFVPAGDYYIGKKLKIYSETHLILEDGATIHRSDVNTGMMSAVDKNGKGDQIGRYEMIHDITLEGGCWDGGDAASTKEAHDLIRFDHGRNITVKNTHIKNVYDCHELEFVGIKDGRIENCTFSGFFSKRGEESNYLKVREAVQLDSAWTSNPGNTKDTSKYWASGSVVDGTPCSNITITKCTFDNMPGTVGQHHVSSSEATKNSNITISYNTIRYRGNVGRHGIECVNMNGISIVGNTIDGPYRQGIFIEGSKGVKVKNNVIDGCLKSGINAIEGNTSSVSYLTGNRIRNCKEHGILIKAGSVGTINANTLSSCKVAGIDVKGGKVKNIVSNKVSGGNYGILCTGGKIGTSKTTGVMSNTVTKNSIIGICVSQNGNVYAISKNGISYAKKHGISMVGKKVRVRYVQKNRFKKITKKKISKSLPKKVKVVISGNK